MIKKLHDIGKIEKFGKPVESTKKKEKYYPDITIDTDLCPIMKDVEVGETLSLLAVCEVKSIRQEGKNKPKEVCLSIKKIGEEGDMKMTKAIEKAIGNHEELDENPKKEEE